MKRIRYIQLGKEERAIGWVRLPNLLDKTGKARDKIYGGRSRRFINTGTEYRRQGGRVGLAMEEGLRQEVITIRRWCRQVTDQPVT